MYYLLLTLLLITEIHGQIFHINGNISADSVPVSYASITFIDEGNSSNIFTALTDITGNYQLDLITGINENSVIPKTIELAQNYPNPFTSETQISYKLKNQSDVHLKIYNILGQEVRTFNIGLRSNGIYGLKWDGKNNFGIKVTPGIYLYRLQAGNGMQVKKMIYAGGNEMPAVPFFSNNSFIIEEVEKTKSITQTKSYTCLIENGNNTNPRILTKEIKGIKIESDSTLNIIVVKESDAYFPLHIGNEWVFQLDGDTTVSYTFKIIKTKMMNDKIYYGFDRRMPVFPTRSIIESLDSIYVRQNEMGDIMLLVDSTEYPYLVFSNPFKEGQSNLACSKIKDVDYCYTIESISDSINTPAGQFNKCVIFVNYFPQVADSDLRIWFAPGIGPVKISYAQGGPPFLLIKINIQK